ncbi:hypothetical protein ABW19_dt0210325 [Dactylella cylindrospora]|nr:hypothetical protein ABW19_dt0210325 [Dactylella cylindrospora]
MPRLELLPFDIKHLILLQLPDRVALRNTVDAVPSLRDVYEIHKTQIDKQIYLNQSKDHWRESLLIALNDKELNRPDITPEEVTTLLLEYMQSQGEDGKIPSYALDQARINAAKKTIIENQRAISELGELYCETKRSKLVMIPDGKEWFQSNFGNVPVDPNEPPPTESEIRRIEVALYKIWVYLLFFRRRGPGFRSYGRLGWTRILQLCIKWKVSEVATMRGFLQWMRDQTCCYLDVSRNCVSLLEDYGFAPPETFRGG